MSRISNRETAILGLLCEHSRYGYELEKIIKERGMRTWTEIGFSSIYYVLKRLESKEFICSTTQEVEGKPSRKIYTVTEKGRKAVKKRVKDVLSQNKKLISPFDLGIAYYYLLEPGEFLDCLRSYIRSLDERKTVLERSICQKEQEGAHYRVIALFSRPVAHIEAEKKWVEQFINKIKKEGL
jgi:DNA-binding PadR family transcriptional regulator